MQPPPLNRLRAHVKLLRSRRRAVVKSPWSRCGAAVEVPQSHQGASVCHNGAIVEPPLSPLVLRSRHWASTATMEPSRSLPEGLLRFSWNPRFRIHIISLERLTIFEEFYIDIETNEKGLANTSMKWLFFGAHGDRNQKNSYVTRLWRHTF